MAGDKGVENSSEGGSQPLKTPVAESSRPVFLSYASHDAPLAQKVCAALEVSGFPCWIAPRDVVPGTLYAEGIVRALDESRVLVLILSEQAVASAHVGKELERATSKRHPIIALKVDSAPLTPAFEYFLNESQWIEVGAGSTDGAIAKLVEAVGRHLAPGNAAGQSPGAQATVSPRKAGSSRRMWGIAAAVVVLALAAAYFLVGEGWLQGNGTKPAAVANISDKSIAVLPFVDMSEKHDQEYFSEGMSEELIDMLSKIPDLRVPARTSSFYFKGKQPTIAEIGKALGVANVLEGSVRKSGTTLRVTAQLIRVDNGYHIWSQSYDRTLDDVFKTQDEIAGAVVKALKVSLLGGALPESAGTQNTEAYNLYLQARAIHVQANSPSDYVREIEYLRRAIDTDPRFANAWALLATTLSVQAELNYVPGAQTVAEARSAAFRALELNPRLPDAHTAVARIFINDFDNRKGEAEVQQALALDPNNSYAMAWAATLAADRGEFEKAMDLARRSIENDPVNPVRYRDLANILFFAEKYPESLAAIRKYDDLIPGANASVGFAVFIMLATGDAAGALANMDRDRDLESCYCRILALDALGRKAEANAALAKLEQIHANNDATGIAFIYANRSDLDLSFRWLARAYQQRESALSSIKVNPLLKNVQADPRFKQLLIKLGLQD
jgi:TolB-like protein